MHSIPRHGVISQVRKFEGKSIVVALKREYSFNVEHESKIAYGRLGHVTSAAFANNTANTELPKPVQAIFSNLVTVERQLPTHFKNRRLSVIVCHSR